MPMHRYHIVGCERINQHSHLASPVNEIGTKQMPTCTTPLCVLYAKLHGLSANFKITDSKARFRGFGGREKVLKQVKLMTGDL